MEKFQELLAEAAQLKQAQLKNERKNYQSLPDYLKSGLNYSRKYRLLRLQPYTIQMTISQNIKNEGNQLFKSQRFEQALSRYEQALGIFRFILAKSYDNMKDEDLTYEIYQLSEQSNVYKEEYEAHLVAIYLNICSTLTKLNRKNDSIHSADEALKIKETAKAYYKKAQSYIQFINRDSEDIKLGFYYLNKSYELSKDPIIIQEMHKVKKEIEQQKDKQKQWFKFMFDKNSKEAQKKQNPIKAIQKKPEVPNKSKEGPVLSENLQRFEKEKGEEVQREDQRLQKTKQKLMKYAAPSLTEQQWIQSYQGQFIAKHGSKIYSILQLYGYKQFLGEYKSLLAQCLQFKKEEQDYLKRKEIYEKYFQWLRSHPIDKIAKYIERYQLQTSWIQQQRLKGGKQIIHKNLPVLKQLRQQEDVKINTTIEEQTIVDSKIQEKILSATEDLSKINEITQLQTKIQQAQLKQETSQNPQVEQIPPTLPNQSIKQFSQIKILAICLAFVTIVCLTLIF